MTGSHATLCQFAKQCRLAALMVSLAANVLGCGATSHDPSADQQTAGKGPMGPATNACTGDAWPAGCEPVCNKPMAGCLLTDADVLPTASVSIEAQVVAVDALGPDAKPLPCFGFYGAKTETGASTLISLQDGAGKSYKLWFPTGLVTATRFVPGATLQVDYVPQPFNIFVTNRQLLVREADELVLFVTEGSQGFPVLPAVDLRLDVGELACPWTAEGCSEARSHTVAEAAGTSVSDPCGATVGGFSVSSLAREGRGNVACGGGGCDIFSSYYSAGARIQ